MAERSLQEMRHDRARWRSLEFVEAARPALMQLRKRRRNDGPLELRGLTLGPRAIVQWLREYDLSRMRLWLVDLEGARIHASLTGSELRAVRLGGAQICGDIGRALLRACDATGTVFSIRGDGARFEECRFRGARFVCGSMSCGGERLLFRSCDFSRAVVRGLRLHDATFMDCNFTDTRFECCDLSGTHFHTTMPDLPQFTECDLRGTRFSR
jgi:uncharacterized protein YjbI with pentapeptide repeats